ncbi:MAG: hypothetical protein AAB019_08190 [Planctomycetota bacterium]|mgnify:CR=1 FL=1
MLKKIWSGWKLFALKFGQFNTRIILTAFYFVCLGPIALIKKLINRIGRIGARPPDSYWHSRATGDLKEDDVRRQY